MPGLDRTPGEQVQTHEVAPHALVQRLVLERRARCPDGLVVPVLLFEEADQALPHVACGHRQTVPYALDPQPTLARQELAAVRGQRRTQFCLARHRGGGSQAFKAPYIGEHRDVRTEADVRRAHLDERPQHGLRLPQLVQHLAQVGQALVLERLWPKGESDGPPPSGAAGKRQVGKERATTPPGKRHRLATVQAYLATSQKTQFRASTPANTPFGQRRGPSRQRHPPTLGACPTNVMYTVPQKWHPHKGVPASAQRVNNVRSGDCTR